MEASKTVVCYVRFTSRAALPFALRTATAISESGLAVNGHTTL